MTESGGMVRDSLATAAKWQSLAFDSTWWQEGGSRASWEGAPKSSLFCTLHGLCQTQVLCILPPTYRGLVLCGQEQSARQPSPPSASDGAKQRNLREGRGQGESFVGATFHAPGRGSSGSPSLAALSREGGRRAPAVCVGEENAVVGRERGC